MKEGIKEGFLRFTAPSKQKRSPGFFGPEGLSAEITHNRFTRPSHLLHSSAPVERATFRRPISGFTRSSTPPPNTLMDANDIIDIPDTPDRVGRPKRDFQDRGLLISHSTSLRGEDSLSMKDGRNDSATQNQSEWRSIHHRRGINISEPSVNGRSSVISVHRHSSASETAPLFRKVGSQSFKPDDRYHINSQHVDDRKSVHLKCSSEPVSHSEHNLGKCVMGGNKDQLQKSSPQCVQKDGKASNSKTDPLASFSLYSSEDPCRAKNYPNKGKAKINDDVCKAIPSGFDQGKSSFSSKNDGSEQKLPTSVSFPAHSSTSSRFSRRRLVRNGCISPLNVEKAKQAAETSSHCNRDSKVDPSVVINVDGELSSGSKSHQVKGKGIVTHHFSSGEHDTERRDLTLRLASGIDPLMNQNHPSNTCKRQKREVPPLSSHDRDKEIIFMGSRSKASSSGSHTQLNRRRPRALDAVIEIDEHSPKIGSSNSRNDNDLAARAIQEEADEMLARELQEQLYHEIPETGSTEGDSHLSRMLQQEANVRQAPRSRSVVNPRGSSSSQPRRQPRSQLFRNRFPRVAQAQAPTSRLARLRNTMQRTSRLFPSEMDLEMRIELLEALEAVVNDDMNMVNQLFNSDREFTEDDYDMLLALDENNHEHLGASNAQISNLPESVVQTSSSETCSICLEEPAIGETIRHLPCLHKFHKDCIDPWLRRKRSCPVCKSDVT